MNNIERFSIPSAAALSQSSDGKQVISGWAIKYNQPSVDLGGYVRMFAPGAFATSLPSQDVMCLYAHEDNHIIAGTQNNSLRLIDTDEGLRYELDAPTFDPYVLGLVESGLIKGASVGVMVADDDWTENDDGLATRTISNAQLVEVSLTNYPAFEQTTVEVKTLSEFRQSSTSERSIKMLLLELNQLLAELAI